MFHLQLSAFSLAGRELVLQTQGAAGYCDLIPEALMCSQLLFQREAPSDLLLSVPANIIPCQHHQPQNSRASLELAEPCLILRWLLPLFFLHHLPLISCAQHGQVTVLYYGKNTRRASAKAQKFKGVRNSQPSWLNLIFLGFGNWW